jgi:phosphate transport system substrate-binding protein
MAAREIHDAEASELVEKGVDPRSPASEHVVALDGIAVVVNPSNSVRSLDRAQIADVFMGNVDDWSAVGGRPAPISVIARASGSGTLDAFDAMVLGDHPLSPRARRLPDSASIADAVTVEPNAIGFVGLAFVRGARSLAVSDQGLPPMLPSAFTVTTEEYFLSRRLYLYTPASPKSLVLEFIDYVMSDAAQQAIRAAGFIDLGVLLKNAEPCGQCSARYATATKNARRLSLDFRFRPNARALDARAVRDVDRVVRFLRDHPTARILLFGFCDRTHDKGSDQKRSRELAQLVDAELGARGLHASVVEGFGSERPVVPDTTDWGRTKNRRVEIWLEDR